MAVLDPRLIPFIETLTDVGVDWLAFEIVDGIRRGREPEESAETLIGAREQARGSGKITVEHEVTKEDETQPLLGDDQLKWAAHYVNERLEETLSEMSASLDNIDAIIGEIPADEAAPIGHQSESTIVLRAEEEDRKVGRAQVDAARGQVDALREALASWLASTATDAP